MDNTMPVEYTEAFRNELDKILPNYRERRAWLKHHGAEEDFSMSTQSVDLSTELQRQIEAFQRDVLPQIPPDIVATLQKTTEDLVKSGIAEHSLKIGDTAPDFTLPNMRGEAIFLSNLLKRGPVVVTFYRGEW